MVFNDPNDIESMRKHEGYKEIKNEVQAEETLPDANENADETNAEKVLKKRGRPSKNVVSEI